MSKPRRGYPLGALFVVVTACAALTAGVTPLVRDVAKGKIELFDLVLTVGSGAACGLLVGIVIGLLQFRMGLGLVMGAGVGTLLGIVGGMLTLLAKEQIATAAAAMTVGSVLVVAVALLMRRREE